MSRLRVLVTRRIFPAAMQMLEAETEVVARDQRGEWGPGELGRAAAGCDALVCQLTDPVDAAVFDAAPGLRLVANVAVGYDNIDVRAARSRGILVGNTPGVLTESTADLAFALLMAAARRLGEAERFLRAGSWRQWEIDLMAGQEVHGQTLGILGPGRIGRAVARRGLGFGMRILVAGRDRGAAAGTGNAEPMDLGAGVTAEVEWCGREELFRRADFVSVHVPLTEATVGLVGASEIGQMPRHGVLVNTARGPVVDEDALIEALTAGRIAAAGLDVYPEEPKVDRRYVELENVVLLPHIASATEPTRARMCRMAAENVVALAQGRVPPHLVHG